VCIVGVERRCLHDSLAGTIVARARRPSLPLASPAPGGEVVGDGAVGVRDPLSMRCDTSKGLASPGP